MSLTELIQSAGSIWPEYVQYHTADAWAGVIAASVLIAVALVLVGFVTFRCVKGGDDLMTEHIGTVSVSVIVLLVAICLLCCCIPSLLHPDGSAFRALFS
jgi:hypothetical protein